MLRAERQWNRGSRDARLSLEHYRIHIRIGDDPGDAEERRESKQGAARPGTERRKTTTHGVLAMLNTTARAQKEKQRTQGG